MPVSDTDVYASQYLGQVRQTHEQPLSYSVFIPMLLLFHSDKF